MHYVTHKYAKCQPVQKFSIFWTFLYNYRQNFFVFSNHFCQKIDFTATLAFSTYSTVTSYYMSNVMHYLPLIKLRKSRLHSWEPLNSPNRWLNYLKTTYNSNTIVKTNFNHETNILMFNSFHLFIFIVMTSHCSNVAVLRHFNKIIEMYVKMNTI